MYKWLLATVLTLIVCGCTTFNEPDRFENVDPEEITENNLPKGAIVTLELKDGSIRRVNISNIDATNISSTNGELILISDVIALSVQSWGDFSSSSPASDSSKNTAAEVTTKVGVGVIEAFGCIVMVVVGGVESEYN